MRYKNVQKILIGGIIALSSLASAAPGWFINTDVNQDFRYRLQTDTKKSYSNDAPYYRERMRYRLGLTSKIGDEFSVGARLATGALDHTVSRTDTYGGDGKGTGNSFGAADINLEQAYLSYAPKWVPEVAGKFKLTGGKMGLSTGIYTTTTIAWDSNIALEGKNLNYTYKDLGLKGLNLFANIGSYVLQVLEPSTEDDNGNAKLGYSNAYLEVQQLGFQYKYENYSADLAYAQYSVPNAANTHPSVDAKIAYDNKPINEINVKLGMNLNVPYFEKVALLYDDFTNPNIENKENKAQAYGIEFGTAKIAKLGDYSLRYLERKIEKYAGWSFYDDAFKTADTKGYQITLTAGLVENVSLALDHFAQKNISGTDKNGTDLSDLNKDKMEATSTRFEVNVKF